MINQKYNILDHGFVRVVDTMGDDKAIDDAARVSYDGHESERTGEEIEKLSRFLTKHKHTSPTEMNEIKIHIKAPLFIARQWLRHRTANVNEKSARYVVVKDEFYIPELSRYVKQSKDNKQCSDLNNGFTEHDQKVFGQLMLESVSTAKANYDFMIEKGVARELARIQLPVNQYVEFYWKIDLRNLLHFCNLRSDKNAQWEIQEYSKVIESVIKQWCPITYKAYIDYQKEAYTISKQQLAVLKDMLEGYRIATDINKRGLSNREFDELVNKLEIK